MPSTRRFEGASLEELLDDVRSEFGSDVTISEANKIRKGGVGGFFAKELFEVVVDVPDDGVDLDELRLDQPCLDDRAPGGPRGLLDLVEAVDDGPVVSSRPAAAMPAEALASEATVQDLLARTADAPLPDERHEDGVAGLLARMASQRSEAVPAEPTNGSLSTDGAAFGDVLRRIASSTRTEPTAPTAPTAPIDDEPFRPYGADRPTPPPAARVVRPVAPEIHAPAPDATPEPTPSPEPDPVATTAVATTPMTAPAVMARGLRARATDGGTGVVAVDVDALGRLGVPEPYRPQTVVGRDRLGSLIAVAEAFPSAPALPDHAGAVIAVVGDRAAMSRAIAWIQDGLGISPEQLMLASPTDRGTFPEQRRLCSAEQAGSSRQSWRRRAQPTLVAIDQAVGLQGTAWTRHILDALEPQAVWGVTDAGRKPEDIGLWAERIGGVDALAVDNTSDTASPAAVLTTGIPVALLDGAAASPARWAAILDERMAA